MDAQAAQATRSGSLARRLARVAPGLPALLQYKRADFPRDLAAGLSVAAIALPVGIAYAQLAGFMNGVALSILLGQIGKLFGFGIDAGGILPRLFEFVSKLSLTHWPTLAVGLGTFAVVMATRAGCRASAALIAMLAAAVASGVLGLEAMGVAVWAPCRPDCRNSNCRAFRSTCSTTCLPKPRGSRS